MAFSDDIDIFLGGDISSVFVKVDVECCPFSAIHFLFLQCNEYEK